MIAPNPSDPESIIRDLAARWPVMLDATCAFCRYVLCVEWVKTKYVTHVHNHNEACVWVRARAWVEENPA
jgi:hypothetical protein